jgi:hypothetical protein
MSHGVENYCIISDGTNARLVDTSGSTFPPRNAWDVLAYDGEETMNGYRDFAFNKPLPGDDRTPAYRWGWQNAQRDATHARDGYEDIRYDYIAMCRRPN